MNFNNKTVAVAMSGGVDSSVAAILLKEQGYNVIGVTGMMLDNEASRTVVQNAKNVCDHIGIRHVALDMTREFGKNVVEYFENSYRQGFTPNPCVVCNRKIKWGKIAEYVFNELKADYYATGHYADIKYGNPIKLCRAADDNKDQIYMLFELKQEDLARTLFPLSKLTKTQVREIAAKYDLPSKSSKDSQDVCFIQPPETTRKYLINKFGEKQGQIVDINTGKVLGYHTGAYLFTIGQRKGIGIAAPKPLYVISTDFQKNIVYVGYKENLLQVELKIHNVNWQQPEYGSSSFNALVKVRYNTSPKPALITPGLDNSAFIKLETPESGITPGQAAVIYDSNFEFLIGGGWII